MELRDLLAQAYGLSESDAQRFIDDLIAEGATKDDLEVLTGIFESVNTTGAPPAGLEAQFQAINTEVQTWAQANATDTGTQSRRQQLRQKFDQFVESSFTEALNPDERALLDQVYAEAFSLFNASGRADEDFQQFIDDSFNRLVAQANLEQQEALADEQQRVQEQQEDAWRGRALRILQNSGIPPEFILSALDDSVEALRGVQASGQDVNLGDGSAAFATANRLFTDTVLDVVDQYTTEIQNQQAAEGELLPPAAPGQDGPPTPTPETIIPQGTQTEAFLQLQATGLTPEQQAQQAANLADDFDPSTEFGAFVSGLDPAFASTLNAASLRAEFQREEQRKAERRDTQLASVQHAAARFGVGVPAATTQGISERFAPSTFSDFLKSRTADMEKEFEANKRLASKPPLRTSFV